MLKHIGFIIFLLAGCSTELHHNLQERAANEIIVALEQEGVPAEKTSDPKQKGTFMVLVPSGSELRSLKVLENNGLPRPEPKGFSAFYPSQGLIPTAGEEQVLQSFARSQEIRRSLLTIDQVLDAQVNLVIPKKGRLRLSSQTPAQPRASVVIRHKGLEAPSTEKNAKDIVSGSVQGLDPKNVVVFFTASSNAGKKIEGPAMVTVGPISVSADSKSTFQGVILFLFLTIIALSGVLIFFVFKRRS